MTVSPPVSQRRRCRRLGSKCGWSVAASNLAWVSRPRSHKPTSWLIEHAVDMLPKPNISQDGRTTYERWTGKNISQDTVESDNEVHYKVSQRRKARDAKLQRQVGARVLAWQVHLRIGAAMVGGEDGL